MKHPDRNHFAAALSAYQETVKPRINLRNISLATGISAGDLSRIRAGKKRVTPETLVKLIAKINPRQAAPLVAAFLKDYRPPGYESLVQIELKSTATANLSRYQQAIHGLSQLEGNPALRRHIISTWETLSHLLKPQAETEPKSKPAAQPKAARST
jgi:hypothetical protein